MKKVAIFNVQNIDNYGAVLQAYALQKTIEKMGFAAKTIKYKPLSKNKVSLSPKEQEEQNLRLQWTSKRHEAFERFREEYMQISKVYHTVREEKDLLDYDIYVVGSDVVGSDVVWNIPRLLNYADAYFLDFTEGKKCLRISYAASFGFGDKIYELRDLYQTKIEKFDCVSIREESRLPFLKSIYSGKVSCCLDSAFLLKREEWCSIIKKTTKITETEQREPYIYVCLLPTILSDNEFYYNIVNQYSSAMGLKVVCYCEPGIEFEKFDAVEMIVKDDGPMEFLSRIYHAEFVISNSFHAAVFSLIMQKEFVILERHDRHEQDHQNMCSSRILDLLKKLKIEDRLLLKEGAPLPKKINYSEVETYINNERQASFSYLKRALNTEIRK